MLHLFRRHRLRLGRSLVGLLALAWMTLALQPCAVAAQRTHATALPTPAHHEHHHHGHTMATLPAAQPAEPRQLPCAPGADCPVFKAVDSQAASKAAEAVDVAAAPVPALVNSWPVPALIATAVPFERRVARLSLPAPPILEFRVLLI